MKAVIPAAGMGTRFLPATKNMPKEMLPLVDKPVIQFVVEEAVAAGFDDILIVTGRSKRAIEDHFDRALELEHALEARGDEKLLREVRRVAELGNIHYVRQSEPLGLGHAVLCARKHIGNEPFALLLGDDVVVAKTPCSRQLWSAHVETGGSVVAVGRTPREQLGRYGVVDVASTVRPGLHAARGLVEKPKPEDAPSDLAVMGRYLLTPDVFDVLEKQAPGRGGEIQLTDALHALAGQGRVAALEFEGRRFDLGTRMEWLKTNIEVALSMPDMGPELRAFLDAVRK